MFVLLKHVSHVNLGHYPHSKVWYHIQEVTVTHIKKKKRKETRTSTICISKRYLMTIKCFNTLFSFLELDFVKIDTLFIPVGGSNCLIQGKTVSDITLLLFIKQNLLIVIYKNNSRLLQVNSKIDTYSVTHLYSTG